MGQGGGGSSLFCSRNELKSLVVVVGPLLSRRSPLTTAAPTASASASAAAAALVSTTAQSGIRDLPLQLVDLALPLRLGVALLLTKGDGDVAQHGAPAVDPVAELAPLLLAEHAVRRPVDQEDLLLLGQLALDEAGADDVDGPQLDLLGGYLQRLRDALVGDLAARDASC